MAKEKLSVSNNEKLTKPNSVNGNYSEVDDIREDLASLKDDVIRLTDHLKRNGMAQAHELKEMTSEQLDKFTQESKKQMKYVEGKVREKPGQSLAIAFAAGVILSILTRRG